MLSMLTWVLYLTLYIFPHMGNNYLPLVMLLSRPGYGIKIALWVYYAYHILTSEAMNVIRNLYSILFTCPSLGCYIWGLYNRTQPLGGGVKEDFFQLFTPDTVVFEGIKFPLNARDSIGLLLVLLCFLCTVYNMLRNKTLHGMMQRFLEAEEKQRKQLLHRMSQRRKGPKAKQQRPGLRRLSQRRKGTESKAPVSVSRQSATEEKETKDTISISTQTITEPEQPKPVAVAPVQKKKSKSKSARIVTDEDAAGPSHPVEETEPEIITRSLSLGEIRDLRREFTRQANESILTWLLRLWDAAANDTILDGTEARQLGSLSREVVIDQGIGKNPRNPQPLAATADKCEGEIPVQRGSPSAPKKMEHHGTRYPMPEGIGCVRDYFLRRREFSQEPRSCPLHITNVAEIRTARTRDVLPLPGNTAMEGR